MSMALNAVSTILDAGLNGLGPLKSASELADDYLSDPSYPHHEARIYSLINWESSKAFSVGFMSSVGGLMTLPVSVVAGVGIAWAVHSRMVGAIARIHGHDLRAAHVRTLVLLAIAGNVGKEVLKQTGVHLGRRGTYQVLEAVPCRALTEINKHVGFRLFSKASEKGVINLSKVAPVAGGLIAGAVDAYYCRKLGTIAHKMFAPSGHGMRPHRLEAAPTVVGT